MKDIDGPIEIEGNLGKVKIPVIKNNSYILAHEGTQMEIKKILCLKEECFEEQFKHENFGTRFCKKHLELDPCYKLFKKWV